MDRRTSVESHGSVHLQISELDGRFNEEPSAGPSPTTMFEPQSSVETKNSSTANSVSLKRPAVRAPEKKLTLFALRLALLEKAACRLGTLGFVWATVVLLGGFAVTLDTTDFWFITIILVIEGARIFSRSHELEWQHQATWSITDVGINSFRVIRTGSHDIAMIVRKVCKPLSAISKASHHSRELKRTDHRSWDQQRTPTRTWSTSEVPFLPYAKWVFMSKNISKLLYWLQLLLAVTCAALSFMKLIRHNYGAIEKGDTDKRNRKAALNIFYSLALAEALLFLLEKAYWEWNLIYHRLLEEVNHECDLGPSGMVATKRFFYDAYSKCVNGSIFDGLKMDMVLFAMELVASISPEEQLIGARILRTFATSPRVSADTLQKIGITVSVMERLVEMLNWKDLQEEEIRLSAAEILSRLAGKKQNALRVAGIPGAMESISSLLHISRTINGAADEISEKRMVFDDETYGSWTFNLLGLSILKKLARDHDNCGKIGNTRGLLPKIIDFTHTGERLLRADGMTSTQILTVKRSLQVVKMLASVTGATGKQLRKEISEIVFTISNVRDILRYGGKYPGLQKLGIEILSSLALEADAKEKIGCTGGIFKELFTVFFIQTIPHSQTHVRISAGEAISMLALESKNSCHRILRLNLSDKLVTALEDTVLRVNAAKILRNLCAYSGEECFEQLKFLTAAGPTVLKAIMKEENKLQEVMIGLAPHVFKSMSSQESKTMYENAEIKEADLANKLIQVLKKHQYPSTRVPRMRRFIIELATWMMKDKTRNIQIFRSLGMEKELECITETISDLESFSIFSGTVGMSRHSSTMHSLVETARELLLDDQNL